MIRCLYHVYKHIWGKQAVFVNSGWVEPVASEQFGISYFDGAFTINFPLVFMVTLVEDNLNSGCVMHLFGILKNKK